MKITCRICQIQQGEFFTLDSEVPFEGNEKKLVEIYNNCLQLDAWLQDVLPQVVCLTCFDKLKDFFEFKLKATKSDLDFRNSLIERVRSNTVKEEPIAVIKNDLKEYEVKEEALPNEDEDITTDSDNGDDEDDDYDAAEETENYEEIFGFDSNQNEEIKEEVNGHMIEHEEDEEDLEDTDILFELYSKNDAFMERYRKDDSQESFEETNITNNYSQEEPKSIDSSVNIGSETVEYKNLPSISYTNNEGIFVHKTLSLTPDSNNVDPLNMSKPVQENNLPSISDANNVGTPANSVETDIEITRVRLPIGITDVRTISMEPLVESRKWSCSDCGRKYLSEEKLEQHRELHTPVENCQCEVCKCSFNTIFQYREHMKSHGEERKFSCEFCDKSFTTRSNLKAHLYSHTNLRPFKCELCSKTFQQKSILKTHMTLHVGKPFQCTLCQRRFSRTAHLNIHMRQHNNIRPYQCTQCSSSYMQKSHLDRHVASTHLGVRYQCTMCGKLYTKKSSLNTHMREAHSKPSPLHTCEICDMDFVKQKGLYYHQKSKHPDYQKPKI